MITHNIQSYVNEYDAQSLNYWGNSTWGNVITFAPNTGTIVYKKIVLINKNTYLLKYNYLGVASKAWLEKIENQSNQTALVKILT